MLPRRFYGGRIGLSNVCVYFNFWSGMEETTYLKIACPSCSEHVEFPSEMRGQVINCPHCTLSLVLELPGATPPGPTATPSENLYQRLRALNNLNARPADINPLEPSSENHS